ncbi:MAG: gamma-glutamyltransferase [Pseudomonadota bacterium]
MRTLLSIVFLVMSSAALAQTQADPEAATGFEPKPLVQAQQHMIVAANPLAAEAGLAVMRAGGSAADAAIAALLVLNVVEPQSSGIGGGAFALVEDPSAGLTAWDAREIAPAGATPQLFLGADGEPLPFLEAVQSGRSVGAPGLVALMSRLHAKHGKLPWQDLFQPAILLADAGFPVSPRLSGLLARYSERLAGTDAAQVFVPNGVPLAEGTILRQPALAKTLRLLASDGAGAFYAGTIAGQIVDAVTRGPMLGTLNATDLAGYRVVTRAPVCHPYRQYRVCGMGPPSSGATTVGQILMLLDRFKPTELELDQARLWHLFAEASRLAYADRGQYLADADFVKVPVRGLLDPAYIAQRSRLIHGFQASEGRAEAGDPPWREGRYAPSVQSDSPGTTHLSVIDSTGLAISLTASIETAFGSGRMAGGFLLNNQLTDFSFRPLGADGTPIANAPAAGKRPRSSMSPTIVYLQDRVAVLTGSPGGSRIPEYVAGSLIAQLAFGLDPAAAAAFPHVSHRNRGEIAIEPGMPSAVSEGLRQFGHQVVEKDMTSGLGIIAVGADGTLQGGADPRREGIALGD